MVLELFSSCSKREPSNAQATDLKAKQGRIHSAEALLVGPMFTTNIGSIFHDSQGSYWFGSQNEGVARFDGETFMYFSVKDGLPGNQIRSIQEGRDGKIWFGTADGVASWDGKMMVNHTLNIAQHSGEPLQKIWTKSDDDLWFDAGTNPGVYRFDGKDLAYLALPADKSTAAFELHVATGFAKGKNGTIWIATYSSVFGYAGNDFTTINNETAGFVNETGELHVRSILEDSKGRLWIGNNGVGVLLVDGDTTVHFQKRWDWFRSIVNGLAVHLLKERLSTCFQSRKIDLGIYGLETEMRGLGNMMANR